MKKNLIYTALAAFAIGLSACTKVSTDTSGQESHEGHDHADHDCSEHEKVEVGPNGGLLLTSVEPHAEIFVTPERILWVTFVDAAGKKVAAGEQVLTVVAGDRANPTNLVLKAEGDKWVAENALPEGEKFDMVVRIQTSENSEKVTERLSMDLTLCEECDHPEYVCTCEHAH